MENYLNIRSGFSDVSESLSARPCKICYLGNSATVQREGYRIILHELINKYFKQKHQSVNAGLGGVGSLACAFFTEDFVVRNNPDVCFVECTTADIGGATPLHLIAPAVEGIVRQLISKKIKVCLLHLYRDKKNFHNPDDVFFMYEQIADHYNVPSINIHFKISEMVLNGYYKPEEIVYDGIHTATFGAQITADIIFGGLKKIVLTKMVPFLPDTPLHSNLFQRTSIVPATVEMLILNDNYKTGKFRNLISFLEIFTNTELLFIPEGDLIAILVIADNDSGVIATDSNNNISYIQLFDEWCEKERLQVVILDTPHPQNVKFKISLANTDVGQKGANTTKNLSVKKANSLKVIGFMVNHFNDAHQKYKLW